MSCDYSTTIPGEKGCYDCLGNLTCTAKTDCDAVCNAVSTNLTEVIHDNFKKLFAKMLALEKSPYFELESLHIFDNKNYDIETVSKAMFDAAVQIYNENTFITLSNHRERKGIINEHDQVKTQLKDKVGIINDLKSLNETTKREVEINMFKTRKLLNTNKVLMIVLLTVGVLVIFPLLSKLGLIPLTFGMGVWAVGLIGILGFMAYKLYFTDMNRDQLEYAKYNFNKPSDEEVAKSRAIAQMNDKDKARCQAFSELEDELDIPNIELDVSQYKTNAPTNKCDI